MWNIERRCQLRHCELHNLLNTCQGKALMLGSVTECLTLVFNFQFYLDTSHCKMTNNLIYIYYFHFQWLMFSIVLRLNEEISMFKMMMHHGFTYICSRMRKTKQIKDVKFILHFIPVYLMVMMFWIMWDIFHFSFSTGGGLVPFYVFPAIYTSFA